MNVSVEEGLRLSGIVFTKTGGAKGRVLIRVGPCKFKRYSIRRRAGDGHTVFRWGRLVGAVFNPDSKTVHFEYQPCPPREYD